MTHEQKIELANKVKSFQESDLYQVIFGPVLDEIKSLKASYDCATLEELATLRGYKKGLDVPFTVMLQIETDAETARAEIKRERERELRNKPPEDSSQL